MKRVVLFTIAVLSCGKPVDPELATKEQQARGSGNLPGLATEFSEESNIPDSGWETYDAGVCCPVDFAIDVQDSAEARAVLVFPQRNERLEMTKQDAAWRVTACTPLVRDGYFYRVAFADDADAGFLWVERVNAQVPTNFSSEQNVFDPNGAATCSDLDAGVHSTLPDAG